MEWLCGAVLGSWRIGFEYNAARGSFMGREVTCVNHNSVIERILIYIPARGSFMGREVTCVNYNSVYRTHTYLHSLTSLL